ncbi:unnamed protein product [Tuber aestivum]|uniref:Uncharacterized protein n=1 Tax=Tuber aestivum TaxID=59557 RepID=A0A292PXZ0_9PEZI|nr:unnamed protein product [Tuber aestivum]
MASTFEIPTITPVRPSPVNVAGSNFHEAHLSLDLHEHFTRTFLQSQPQISENQPEHEPEQLSEDQVEGEDGLGYYPDGTKRTLTSTQVDMFRKRRRAAAKKQAAKDRRAQRDEQTQPMDGDTLIRTSAGPEEVGEITELDRMKSRLQAAVWASSHGWDKQATEERAVPRVIETVDVGTGKNFLWPAIEKGDW